MSSAHAPSNAAALRADRAYIALGSNMGDRFAHIGRACAALDAAGLRVQRTSALYETAPMYVADQAPFLNGVAETDLPPGTSATALLATLQTIETQLGRVKLQDKGPRCIDLDILLLGASQVSSAAPALSVPHAAMLEREFVLRPLADLIPSARHPGAAGPTYAERLARFPPSPGLMPALSLPAPRLGALRPHDPARPTRVMAIMNLTPDSFSDGGALAGLDPAALVARARRLHAAGAAVLDVGGQSTRPRAAPVPAEEEAARVLPAIRAVRAERALDGLALSVDTFRASVAEAAVRAGADMVNDVSAGALDPLMLPTLARLGCGVVLMHMRGDPATMTGLTDYSRHGGVVAGVAAELGERVDAALRAGVRRWRIVLDPGLGFAKTASQNLELLRRLGDLRQVEGLSGLPWMVGASRKGFVGKITGVEEPAARTWGTAATVAAAVQGGADLMRVHDVGEMAQVAKMADAIWRVE